MKPAGRGGGGGDLLQQVVQLKILPPGATKRAAYEERIVSRGMLLVAPSQGSGTASMVPNVMVVRGRGGGLLSIQMDKVVMHFYTY